MYDGADGILKLILQYIIWCLQNGSRDCRTPLPTIILGWSQNLRSMEDGFCFSSKFIGSRIIWLRSSASIAIPSLLVFPSGHLSGAMDITTTPFKEEKPRFCQLPSPETETSLTTPFLFGNSEAADFMLASATNLVDPLIFFEIFLRLFSYIGFGIFKSILSRRGAVVCPVHTVDAN